MTPWHSLFWLPLLSLWAAPGCTAPDDGHTTLVVSVSGLSPQIQSLRVSARLSGQAAREAMIFTGNLSQFGVRLPRESHGPLVLDVAGLAADGCQEAEGRGEATLEGQRRLDVSVSLGRLLQKACLLQVERAGPGQGAVRSEPAGISCGDACVFSFPWGGKVALSSRAEPESVFAGWDGACMGTDPCQIQLDRAVRVRAAYGKRVCGPTGWCWEHPLPQGDLLNAVWGSGPDTLWAVGAAGTVMRWDGATWTRLPAPTDKDLYGVWGSGNDSVWIVGQGGMLLRWNGADLRRIETGSAYDLRGVWGSAPGDVWIAGRDPIMDRGQVLRWDGTALKDQKWGGGALMAVWGSGPTDVWVGGQATLSAWDGARWSTRGAPPDLVFAIWGRSKDDVWVTGNQGLILHWDGQKTSAVPSGTTDTLSGVWGSAADQVYFATWGGAVLKWNGKSVEPAAQRVGLNLLAGVWGSGQDNVWAVGAGLLRLTARGWVPYHSGDAASLWGIWASGPNDAWAVGYDTSALSRGVLLHFDGVTWSPVPTELTDSFFAVFGTRPSEVWFAGGNGAMARWNGSQILKGESGVKDTLSAIWGAASYDLWAVGANGVILRGNGTTWSRVMSPTTQWLRAVWGSGTNDVWAGGSQGVLLRWDGTSWRSISTGTTWEISAIWGSGPNDVWFTGGQGTILRWDGMSVKAVQSPAGSSHLRGLWGSGPNDVWAGGWQGVLFHYDGDRWKVAGPRVAGGDIRRIFGLGPDDIWSVGHMILRRGRYK
jgi:hypothetical protein